MCLTTTLNPPHIQKKNDFFYLIMESGTTASILPSNSTTQEPMWYYDKAIERMKNLHQPEQPERETYTIWAYIMKGLAAVGENAEPGPHQKIHLRPPEASSWYNLTDGICHTCGADISNCGCYPSTCMVSNKDFTHCGCSDCKKYPTPRCRRTVRSPAKDWRTSVMQEPPVASGYDSYRALFPRTTRD